MEALFWNLSRALKLFLAAVIAFFGVLVEFPGTGVPNPDCLKNNLNPPGAEVYTIERSRMTDNEHIMITSLQGITAKKQAKIYIRDGVRGAYLDDYLTQNPIVKEIVFTDPWALVAACQSDLADNGMVLFAGGDNPGANMAATIAGVECWLVVAQADAAKAQALGLTEKRSFAGLDWTAGKDDPQLALFREYQDRLYNGFLLHQAQYLVTTRDFSIALGAPCIYTTEDDLRGKVFRSEVFQWMQENSPVFGWTTNEGAFVQAASQNGLFVVAADHASNLSFLSAIGTGDTQTQPNKPEKLQADPTKHYIAIVVSDGDNLQWFYNNFSFDNGHFGQRQNGNTRYKMSWTSPPIANRVSPGILARAYATASGNDSFVTGVSGAGYINPSRYPKKYLKNFAALTDALMAETDQSVVCLLDGMGLFNSAQLTALEFAYAYRYFAQQPNISGGLIQCGDRYQQLGGKIIWSEGKPFISCGKSFWYPGDDKGMTEDWVRKFAAELNALPADITTENGYTYLNVHPWSASIEHLELLVSLLDEHVELVFAEELVQLVTDNVMH